MPSESEVLYEYDGAEPS